MTAAAFSVPDHELAHRILSLVPYGERFPAGRLRPPIGVMPGTIRSLHELHLLLEPDDRSLPGLNLEALPAWIGSVVGDRELADRVQEAVATMSSYVDGCMKTFLLVESRLVQARTVTGEEVVA